MGSKATANVQCKLVLVGNGSVGKTSIIARFTNDGFRHVYKQTIGCDFFEKELKVRGDQLKVTMQVWDIGGQSLNAKMMKQYIHGAKVVFLCYDVTDSGSFDDLDDWLKVVRKHSAPHAKPQVHLVGNKIDLTGLRRVSQLSHDRFISANNLSGGFQCSAMTGDKVLSNFYALAANVVGVKLSSYDLAFHEKVCICGKAALFARAGDGAADEGRTPEADAIEAEDMALEAKKQRAGRVPGCICS
ncbi:unnamed protein product [Chrysoparadoxa australica]